jgi:hypothetical protein
MKMQGRAAVIGIDLDGAVRTAMLSGRQGSSASHTTLSGNGKLNYREVDASRFCRLGVLGDGTRELAASIARIVDGASRSAMRGWQSAKRNSFTDSSGERCI